MKILQAHTIVLTQKTLLQFTLELGLLLNEPTAPSHGDTSFNPRLHFKLQKMNMSLFPQPFKILHHYCNY